MKYTNLNLIPEKIEQGIISKKEALNIIAEFMCLNPPVFGLQKYDEDFREDIILDLLEKGIDIFDTFDKSKGEFFTYLFYKIRSFIQLRIRCTTRNIFDYTSTLDESIKTTEEKEYKYNSINYKKIELIENKYVPKVPYTYKTEITPEELRKTFENIHGDKKLLVVAIKSAYYITDPQIDKVCNYYKLEEYDFLKAIQYCKNKLMEKAEKKQRMQERRNSAYIHHKNLETQIHNINHSLYSVDETPSKKDNFISKNKKYYRNWKLLNNQLEAGTLALRPTNKTIASILGICERQVAYYIYCAKLKNRNSNEKDTCNENYN